MIIAITNSKGGVGKTTIAVHQASWLAMHGCSVVLVDCDAQRLSSKWTKAASPEISAKVLDTAEAIARELPKLANEYDAVIVDAPGGLSDVTVAILSATDAAIVPTSGGQLDVQGLSWTIKTIQEIQSLRDGMPLTVVLPVKADGRFKTTRNLLLKAKRLGFGVTRIAIKHRQIYSQVAGLENDDGQSWEIPPSFLWNLGRSQKLRDAALELDAAFQEIFPEACEANPDLVKQLVSPRKKIKVIARREDDRKIAAGI